MRYKLDEKEQKQHIEGDLPLNNSEIKTWKFSQEHRQNRSLNLDVSLTINNQIREIGDMLIVRPISSSFLDLEKPVKRRSSIRINYPISQIDSTIYNLTFINQFKVDLPKNKSFESRYGKFNECFKKVNNQLIVVRNFQLYKGEYSLKEYPALYDFIEKMKKSIKNSVIILNKL